MEAEWLGDDRGVLVVMVRVWVLGSGVGGLGFRVWALNGWEISVVFILWWFRVWGLGSGV